jgi:starch-binding outer membrane protein, SusD/RagB family
MKKTYKIILSIFLTSTFVFSGCSDLDVENKNQPDQDRVLSTPDDLLGVMGGAYVNFWQTQTRAEPNCVLFTISDLATCSWGNFGMNLYSSEPRVPFDNNSTSAFSAVGTSAWLLGYGGIGAVNDVLRILENNPETVIVSPEVTSGVKASGYFIQGAILGHLALLYDRTYAPDEFTDLPSQQYPEVPNYNQTIDFAVEKLEKAIQVCENNSFTLHSSLMRGVGYNQTNFAKLAHTYIARLLTYKARTAAENSSTDWSKVEFHARRGIDFDFIVQGDNNLWYNEATVYISYPGWGRVDQRVINLADPAQPTRYPEDGTVTIPPVSANGDSRFSRGLGDNAREGVDFEFIEGQAFIPARGLYHYSNYRHIRHDDQHGFAGPMVLIRRAENDLLLAESIVRQSGNNAEVAELINRTWVNRGDRTPVIGSESSSEVLNIIFTERHIELFNTNAISGFADMRRRDMLQPGTFTQLPVPGSQLELLGIPLYTYPGGN